MKSSQPTVYIHEGGHFDVMVGSVSPAADYLEKPISALRFTYINSLATTFLSVICAFKYYPILLEIFPEMQKVLDVYAKIKDTHSVPETYTKFEYDCYINPSNKKIWQMSFINYDRNHHFPVKLKLDGILNCRIVRNENEISVDISLLEFIDMVVGVLYNSIVEEM